MNKLFFILAMVLFTSNVFSQAKTVQYHGMTINYHYYEGKVVIDTIKLYESNDYKLSEDDSNYHKAIMVNIVAYDSIKQRQVILNGLDAKDIRFTIMVRTAEVIIATFKFHGEVDNPTKEQVLEMRYKLYNY